MRLARWNSSDPQGAGTLELTGIGSISQTANPPMPFGGLAHRVVRRVYGVVRGPVAVPRHSGLAFAGECLLGVTLVALLTLLGVATSWNLSTATLVFLLLVVLSAVRYGFWQASVISLAAVVVQSYCFAPPAFSFYIADPQNGIAIVVFEATALLVSHLSTRERSHAIEVERQRRSLEQMFAISRGMLLLDLQQSPVREMAELIFTHFGAHSGAGAGIGAVAILSDETCENGHGELKTAGAWPWDPEQAAIRAATPADASETRAEIAGLSQRTLLVANAPIGSLLVLSGRSAVDALTMDALASMVSLTLERYRAFHNERSSKAAQQTEQLRTAVLDGLAHAFKTPLTIIRAASSGLLEMGELSFAQQELTLLIDTESMRLDELATRLLQTARMDDAKIALEREAVSVRAMIREVAAAATRGWDEHGGGRADSPRVQVLIETGDANDPLTAMADYEMLAATLRELMENAAKYCIAGSPITVRASETALEVMVSVHNRGPVIALADRERIFERFYRCPSHLHSAPGTGIGLSMARHAIEAHGGHIWVISGEHQGTTFQFALPKRLDERRGNRQETLPARGPIASREAR